MDPSDSDATTLTKSDLKINGRCTKVLEVSKIIRHYKANIEIKDKTIDRVQDIRHLGNLIAEDGKSIEEIKRTMDVTKQAFEKRK